MKRLIIYVLLFCSTISYSQQKDSVLHLKLSDAVRIAITESPQFLGAKNNYISSYWGYNAYKASMLPSITLNTKPLTIDKGTRQDVVFDKNAGEFKDVTAKTDKINSKGSLTIKQSIPLTGGEVSIGSNLNRLENRNAKEGGITYSTDLVSLNINQNLFKFNEYAHNNKVEPLKFEMAKRNFVKRLENLSLSAVNMYYNLASAKVNLGIQQTNFNSNDTLLKISQGRFKMGKISKNDLLQMELNKLTSQKKLKEAKLNLRSAEISLIAFLGLKNVKKIEVDLTDNIPNFKVLSAQVFQLTRDNNPKYLDFRERLLESNAKVERKKDGRYFTADLNASIGLSKFADNMENLIDNPSGESNLQRMSLNITIPILDWGMREGNYKMAQYNDKLVKLNVEKERIEFEQNLDLFVRRFNMQESQLEIAKKSNEIAQNKYDITKQRFLLGKIKIIELDKARTEKDQAKISHINTLKTFWKYYYDLRAYTLYDFEEKHSLLDQYSSFLIDLVD
jgi:outer membrane protein TolC